MACEVATWTPWRLFRGRVRTPSDLTALVDSQEQKQVRELYGALSDGIAALAAEPHMGLEAARHLGWGRGGQSAQSSGPEDMQRCLQTFRKHLEEASGDGTPSHQEARKVVLQLMATDVPEMLVRCLGALDFEAQKDAARLFGTFLKLGGPLGIDAEVVDYMQSHAQIIQLLLEGSGRPEVATHCAQMLRCCTRSPALVRALLDYGTLGSLIDLAQHQSFDISSEAFSSLKELLLAQKAVSSAYVQANFEDFFGAYNGLLEAEDYVTQRQALRLLGDLLLDRGFMQVMIAYVCNERFLQIHMKLLRHSSKAIQLDAFHVFKVFAANPNKPRRVQQILYQNKEKLVRLLETFHSRREGDGAFAADLRTVIGALQALDPPAKAPNRTATKEACEP